MKTKFTRVISAILMIALIFSLAACSGKVDTSTKTEGGKTETSKGDSTQSGDKATEETASLGSFKDIGEGMTTSASAWYRGDVITYTGIDTGKAKTTPEDTIILGSSQSTITGVYPSQTMQEYVWSFNIYESLLQVNWETGEVEPCLATEVAYDDNGNLHITLREGVKFHDGNTMTAEDVMFTFKQLSEDLKCPAAKSMKCINFEKSYIEDDTHLVFVFDYVDGSFYSYLSSAFTGIMSKAFVESVGSDYSYFDADAGTGPYYLVETTGGISQTFKAFEDYWGGKPAVGTIIYNQYEDQTALEIDYETGNIDAIFSANYGTTSRAATGELSDTTLYELPNSRYMEVIMRTTGDNATLADKRIREAIACGTNLTNALIAVYETEQMANFQSTSVLLPGTNYKVDVGTYEYDPDRAVALLAEAGYSKDKPCHLKIYVGTGGGGAGKNVLAEAMQGSLNELGFDIEIEVGKSNAVTTRLNSFEQPCDVDIIIQSGNSKAGIPNAVFSSRDAYGKELGEYSAMLGVVNEEFHNLLVEAEATTDEALRAENYARIQEIFHENIYYLNLLPNTCYWVCADYIENMSFSSGVTGFWKTWTLAE